MNRKTALNANIFHKLCFDFFNKEMNFTAGKGEIRQYYVQQAFLPEFF